MFIIGTAGHIDHGKSTLIKALTGIDPDRLPEEKQRGMTIDLGFAWLTLPDGNTVGFVDVPGHRDLVRNVLAGVWGIDAVLLVVAADDGWMPQTEEHLQILHYYAIRHGIVVITRTDLVDEEWLEMVEDDVHTRLQSTVLADAPVVRFSAVDTVTVKPVRDALETMVSGLPPRRNIGKPMMPVDRVFTIKGSGTVVTGTLIDGTLKTGDRVVIFPDNATGRIRGIESYKTKTDSAEPGNRIALNIAGIERNILNRGDIVFAGEKAPAGSDVIDAEITLLASCGYTLKSGTEVMLYTGTSEHNTRVILLEKSQLVPGETAFAQLRLQEPGIFLYGDRFVLRRLSPPLTIGGGIILDPSASRHKARDIQSVVYSLHESSSLDVQAGIAAQLRQRGWQNIHDLLVLSHFSQEDIEQALYRLIEQNRVIRYNSIVVDAEFWPQLVKNAAAILEKEHRQHPLDEGLSLAEWQTRMGVARELGAVVLETLLENGTILRNRDTIALVGHKPGMSPDQTELANAMVKFVRETMKNPPLIRELLEKFPSGNDVMYYLIRIGTLVELPESIIMEFEQYQTIKAALIDMLESSGSLTIQQVRESFGYSRKHILPLFMQLDADGITRREGDVRVLNR